MRTHKDWFDTRWGAVLIIAIILAITIATEVWAGNAVTKVPKLHRAGQDDSLSMKPDTLDFVFDDVVQAFMYVGTFGISTMNHLYVDTLYAGKSTTGSPYRNSVAADSLLATEGQTNQKIKDSTQYALDAIHDSLLAHFAGWVFGDITGVTAGNGLTGGGTSGAVTVNVVGGWGIGVYGDSLRGSVVDLDGRYYREGEIDSAGYLTSETGDIAGVTAGAGMTGGGTTGSVTLNVIGSNHLTIAADSCYVVSIDSAVIANQGITADDIDTTDNDFVFSRAFKGTSSVVDSQLMTKGYGDANWSGGGSIKWWDSAYVYLDTTKIIYDLIDTTTAKIPTATLADSTNGGATRATTSKEADSTDGGAIRSETAKKILTGEDEVSFDTDTFMVIIDNDTIRMRVYVGDDGETVLDLGGDTTIVEGMLRGDTLLAFQFFKAVVSADSALVTKAYGDANWSGGGSIKWRESCYVYLDTTKIVYDLIDTTTAKIPTATLADSTAGGSARAESAQGLVGFAINSVDPANGEVLTYYTPGDTLGWSAALTGGYADSSGWSRNMREYAGADSLYFDTDTVKYSGTDLIIGGGPITAYFTDALISLYAPTTFGDTVWMDGNVLTGLPDPANDSDAVSKGYADANYLGGSSYDWLDSANVDAGWGLETTADGDDSLRVKAADLDQRYFTEAETQAEIEDSLDEYVLTASLEDSLDAYVLTTSLEDSLDAYVLTTSLEDSLDAYLIVAAISGLIGDSCENYLINNGNDTTSGNLTALDLIANDDIFVDNDANGTPQIFFYNSDAAILYDPDSSLFYFSTRIDVDGHAIQNATHVETDSLGIGGDEFVDLTGTGLSVTDGVLSATLGTSVDLTAEITGTLPVGNGGTGATTLTDGGILLGSGTGAITPLGQATNGQLPIGSTGADPVLGAISGTTYDIKVTNGAGSIALAMAYNATLAGNPTLTSNQVVFGTNGIIFEGATANTYEALLTVADPTADRTITLPNASFTVPNPDATVTLTGNWVNTTNPWADNEVADNITVTGYMQDEDINTFAELQAWVSDSVLVTEKGVGNDIHDSVYAVVDSRYIATIYSPNGLWVADSILVVIDPRTPSAITVTRIDVTCDADPATELDFDLMWADAFIGNANRAVVDEMNTTSGATTITSGFDDATVPANKCIYIRFNAEPDAAMTQVGIRVTYTKD